MAVSTSPILTIIILELTDGKMSSLFHDRPISLLHSNLTLHEKCGRISEITFLSSVPLALKVHDLIYVEMYITTDVLLLRITFSAADALHVLSFSYKFM